MYDTGRIIPGRAPLAFFSLLLIAVAMGTFATRAIGDCVPPPSGMTGWWPGDCEAIDIVGGRNGVMHGNATTGAGLVEGAFRLDGNGDWIEVADDPAFDVGTGDFSVDLWVYFNTIETEQVLVEKWVQYGGLEGYGWTFTKTFTQELVFALAGGFLIDDVRTAPGVPIPTGTWVHFAARRANGLCEIFMNGQSLASRTLPQACDSDASLKFGHRGNPSDTPGSIDTRDFFLNGRIDEVEYFVGHALSDAEIQSIVSSGPDGKCKSILPPSVLTGPTYYSGHSYYLLGSATWEDAEARAVSLGGHLAAVNDGAEEDWIYGAFGNYMGSPHSLWIGLTDRATEGTFVWSNGDPVGYTHWQSGEPNECQGREDYTHVFPPSDPRAGMWNDILNSGSGGCGQCFAPNGVVEVPGLVAVESRPGQSGPFDAVIAPNPFSRGTTVRFRLARRAPTSFTIFDASGRQVRSIRRSSEQGENAIEWDGITDDGRRAVPGVYVGRLEATGVGLTRRLLLVR